MPVKPCTHEGLPGYRWGNRGKCYTYSPGDAVSRAKAYVLAQRQGSAQRADAGQDGKRPVPSSHRRYERYLLRYMTALERAVMAKIDADLRAAAREERENERADSIARYLARLLRSLASVRAAVELNTPQMEAELDALGATVDKHTTRQTAVAVGASVQMIDVFSRGPTKGLISTWVGENVSKIKTLSSTLFSQLEAIIETGAREALSTENIRRRIQRRFGVSRSWAKFVARDQIATLNSRITQTKQQDLGVKQYRWSTSGDERVREPWHTDLDGRTFSWDSPPVTNKEGEKNHPGADYNCRCVAIPIIDLTPRR